MWICPQVGDRSFFLFLRLQPIFQQGKILPAGKNRKKKETKSYVNFNSPQVGDRSFFHFLRLQPFPAGKNRKKKETKRYVNFNSPQVVDRSFFHFLRLQPFPAGKNRTHWQKRRQLAFLSCTLVGNRRRAEVVLQIWAERFSLFKAAKKRGEKKDADCLDCVAETLAALLWTFGGC